MSDSVQPHRRQPTRLPHPWDSPGKNTGGCHFLHQCMKVKRESEVAQSCRLLATPWTAAYQAPPSKGFSRQEYWSGAPLASPPSTKEGAKKITCSPVTDHATLPSLTNQIQVPYLKEKQCELSLFALPLLTGQTTR